jgi:uncharacterized protein (DUF427 family)
MTFEDFEALGKPKTYPSERWVRVKFGGQTIADTKQATLLIQYGPGGLPTYYFPQSDVSMALLTDPEERDGIIYYTVTSGDKHAPNAAWHPQSPELTDLRDKITFQWDAMDAWFEEEEEIFVHARDPFKRVDVMPSSRHIKVVVNGETVAETQHPSLLFETHLPTRYYIPREDVNMNYLQPTERSSQCPYKGVASYWSVGEAENIAWSYPDPIPECPKIKDLMCFFNEKVDIYENGDLLARPITPWS